MYEFKNTYKLFIYFKSRCDGVRVCGFWFCYRSLLVMCIREAIIAAVETPSSIFFDFHVRTCSETRVHSNVFWRVIFVWKKNVDFEHTRRRIVQLRRANWQRITDVDGPFKRVRMPIKTIKCARKRRSGVKIDKPQVKGRVPHGGLS